MPAPTGTDAHARPTVVDRLPAEIASFAHELVAAAAEIDGVAPLSEQAVSAIDSAPDPTVRHIFSEAGYGNVIVGRPGEPAMVEIVVDPTRRRRGFGRELLAAAFDVARGLRAEPGPRAWAHGDLPGAVALAASVGVIRRRELLQMRRPVGSDAPELPALEAPDDIILRTYAGPADNAEILRVNNAAFDWHPEQGGWSDAQIVERVRSPWFDPAGLFLAFDVAAPGHLLGFHWTKMQSASLGEVYIVGIDPGAQGRGLGRLLTLAGLKYLAGRGVDEIELYVEGDNTAALHTYSRLGFTRYAVDVAYG
ncbi:mycothiol synthase [Gordonia rhizosphera]|uniref:Mycothiol acetyltransferase n=1 Tax=Gordonia rhizosphera NBRC 16068 TaxID=1108045 RepID=K6W115_9ACTN|nr:mycothiol synthase [Gordonia rhizosphera]GAB92840.1 acetyltransferase MshD [Gordonia rhizosphera NBRC 16068]